MMRCCQRHRLLFGILKIRDKHNFVITNAFYTLEDQNLVDIIKTCQYCGEKESFLLDKKTLLEVLQRFPNAFKYEIKSYLQTWVN